MELQNPQPADPGIEAHSFDLADLVRRVAAEGGRLTQGAVVDPPEREKAPGEVEVLDEPKFVTAQPLEVAGFVDGVQAAVTLAYHGHRPVTLQYAGAAAVAGRGEVIAVDERLEIVHSEIDVDWALAVAGDLPRHCLSATAPHDVVAQSVRRLKAVRVATEHSVVAKAAKDGQWLVLDGSLAGRPVREGVVGVVKTTKRRYLSDEAQLWRLDEGWRSSRFRIPAGVDMGTERWSCYLRLFSARSQPWDFALVRLEAFDPDVLDALAARCMLERQGSGHDRRWDRHLGGVRMVEDVLRARRPELM